MWPNNNDDNSFTGNAPFQNGFNQDDFSPSPFGNGAATPLGGQPIFTQLPFDTSSGEGFQNGGISDLSMFNNQTAFQQNQFMHPLPFSPSFVPQNLSQNQSQPLPATDSPRRTPQLDAKTAELKERLIKARLMKSRAAQSSSDPSLLNANAGAMVSTLPPAPSTLLRGSPTIPITAVENREEDLNALISEFSTPNVMENTSTQKIAGSTTENNASSSIPTPSRTTAPAAKSPAPSVAYPAKVTAIVANGPTNGNHVVSGTNGNENKSRESSISEGEILEEFSVSIEQPPIQPQNNLPLQKPINNAEQLSQRSKDESSKPTPARGPMGDVPSSPRRTLPTQPRSQRNNDERRDEPSTRHNRDRDNRRPHDTAYKLDRNIKDETDRGFTSRRERPLYDGERDDTDRNSYRRRPSRDEEPRKSEPETEPKSVEKREEPREEPHVQAQITPAMVSHLDIDVRDWLEFTGFHDEPHRVGVLDRRRRLRALDEQRRQILGEIESEEKAKRVQPPGPAFSSMLPPPAPTKPADNLETYSTGAQVPPNGLASQESSNKRSHSDVAGSPSGAKVKVARTDDGGMPGLKINGEDSERNLPRSSGYGSSRRSSFDHRDYEENIRYDEERTRGRDSSREREYSPRRTGLESGQAGRFRQYDDEDHGDDRPNAGARRGNYESDFYRNRGPGGRGRGGAYRGRGRGWHDDNKGPGPSSKTGGKPFKDPKGFRGGKSGQ